MLRPPPPNAPAYPGVDRPHRERRDAAEHRQQVLDAASRLFAERGVQVVTMEEIAQAAGVGKGTLYRRYTDKGQLVLALMSPCVARLQDDLDATLGATDAVPGGQDVSVVAPGGQDESAGQCASVAAPGGECASVAALDQLDAVLARLVGWIEEHSAQLGVLADQAAGERRGAMLAGPLYQWLHAVVVGLLARADASGEAFVDDCVYVADALLATLDIDLYLFQRHDRGYSPARILAGLHRLVVGLRAG
jgi:AcrR family transcriptional regulator